MDVLYKMEVELKNLDNSLIELETNLKVMRIMAEARLAKIQNWKEEQDENMELLYFLAKYVSPLPEYAEIWENILYILKKSSFIQ